MSDSLGTKLGKYEIIARIAQGGMARVYQAYHPTLERYVAVKILHAHLAQDPNFISRFRREASAVARLRHPNIVQVYDFDVQGDETYMVMEYIDGPSLKAELEERQAGGQLFTLNETGRIFHSLAGAIDYAHTQSMVHRDIKPANVLFTSDGQVRLTDFGLVRILGANTNTQTGSIAGTPTYMSPEQCQGKQGDARSDIYSLGIMFYEMITGHVPFSGETPLAVLMKHITEELPSPLSLNPDLPKGIEYVISRATAKDPAQRFQTAGEMSQALLSAIGMLGESYLADLPIPVMAAAPYPSSTSSTPLSSYPAPLTATAPYRGLLPFRQEDTTFFFGREAFIQRLVQAVREKPFVAIIGPSGSGKSSVVFAGLLPRLYRETQWAIADFRLGSRPLQSLASALITWLETDITETDRLVEVQKLQQALHQGTLTLNDVIQRVAEKHPERGQLLLVADQFEELYTLCPDPEVRRRFLTILLDGVADQRQQSPKRLTLVLTLRADFLGQALAHRPFAEALQDGDLKIGPMSRQELQQAIENPARKQGATFEPGLVERILDDVGDESGNLPLLQFALTLLWEERRGNRLTHATYQEIGRVAGALARYAEELYSQLNGAEQSQIRQILVQMVRPGAGTEDTRRLATRTEIGEAGWEMVQKLTDARLLITGRDPSDQETVEIVHETLIRRWQRFRQWLDEDREFLLWRQRLRASLRQWINNKQDEGALLRGALLVEAEGWLDYCTVFLSKPELDFIYASVDARLKQEQEEKSRARQQIEDAHRLAEAERKRASAQLLVAHELRSRARVLRWAVGVAGTLALIAIIFGVQSWRNAQLADQNATAAQAARNLAVAQQNIAIREASLSGTAQAEAEISQAIAELERDRADEQAQIALTNFSRLLATQSQTMIEQIDLALLLSLEAYRVSPTWEARQSLWQALETNPALVTSLRGHQNGVNSVAFSADGQWIVSGGEDGSVRLWETQNYQPVGELTPPSNGRILAVALSPDNRYIAAAGSGKEIVIWDRQNLVAPPILLSGHTALITSLAFAPDSRTLASGSADKTVRLWDVVTEQLGSQLVGHTDFVYSLAFNGEGSRLVSGSKDQRLILWDVTTSEMLGDPIPAHSDWVLSVAFSGDGRMVASGGADHAIRLWTVMGDGRLQPQGNPLMGHTGWVQGLAFHPQGELLVSAGGDGTVRLWDVVQGQLMQVWQGHEAGVMGVGFSPDGQMVASAGTDSTILLWQINTPTRMGVLLSELPENITSLAYGQDGNLLAVAGATGREVLVWDKTKQQISHRLAGHTAQIVALTFHPHQPLLAVATADRSLTLWDLIHSQKQESLSFRSAITAIEFSPDGNWLVIATRDNQIFRWNISQNSRVGSPIEGHQTLINDLAFSPDSQWLISGGEDSQILVWDIATGQQVGQPLTGHVGGVVALTFLPDSQILVSGGRDRLVRVWDLSRLDANPLVLEGHEGDVVALTVTADGSRLATGSLDGTVFVWDTQSWTPVLHLLGQANQWVTALGIAPDGQEMAVGYAEAGMVLWNLDELDWQEQACRAANRNFTLEEWRQFFGDKPYRSSCEG